MINKTLYQRNGGDIFIYYQIDENTVIQSGTSLITNLDEFMLLGEISSDISDLIRTNDYINGHLVFDIFRHSDNTKTFLLDNGQHISSDMIKNILTCEKYLEGCVEI